MNIKYNKEFKELEIILSDFKCDKNCPYCTAKITNWPIVKDDIHQLSLYVGQLKQLGYTFHYVTIGGNGEPTLHSYQKLKEIVDMFKDYDIPVKRVLTSGNIFNDEEYDKWKLFYDNNWFFECTTSCFNHDKDRKILGYKQNYFDTERFKKSRIRLNYVLLKSNINELENEIYNFLTTYPNIETFALKLLNINTKTGLVDNRYSEWIVNNAVPKTERDAVAELLNQSYEYIGERYDTCSWKFDDTHEIYFSWKKMKYGYMDLVYYGNKFINYQLEEIKLDFLPKVYIASRFIKSKNEDGSLSLKNDFRTKLIGNEKLFMDFNNKTFIVNKEGIPIMQYIGPFYNEKASDGTLTSTICDEVVKVENELIDKSDIFIAYFDDIVSPGGITELIYTAFKKKKILVFFKQEENIEYELKTSNWYPIIAAKQIQEQTQILPVHSEQEIINYFAKGAI